MTPSSTIRSRRARAKTIVRRLETAYGSPRHSNKQEPVDELFFIVLSQMTTQPSFDRVFERLKAAYRRWDELLDTPVEELQTFIHDAGLSHQKAPRMKAIARRLADDFGMVSLDKMRTASDADLHDYLTSLPGVGIKTAKCVMMYAFGREVLPADTHVTRVCTRLGLIVEARTPSTLHRELEAVVRPGDRYSLHVNALSHGRAVCRAGSPRCNECPVESQCAFRSAMTLPARTHATL